MPGYGTGRDGDSPSSVLSRERGVTGGDAPSAAAAGGFLQPRRERVIALNVAVRGQGRVAGTLGVREDEILRTRCGADTGLRT